MSAYWRVVLILLGLAIWSEYVMVTDYARGPLHRVPTPAAFRVIDGPRHHEPPDHHEPPRF